MERSGTFQQEHFEQLRHAILARDTYTARHCDRTCELALALARHCALSERELFLLRLACPLHDLGKLGIPDAVLLKPGRLDEDEWALMRTHAERGYQMLTVIDDDDARQIAPLVRHHHENFNGQGYPLGLAGDAIPLLSRILALADSYDAMASRRAYHAPLEHARIMHVLLEDDGGKFDPWLRSRFADFIESSPYRADRWVGLDLSH